MDNLGIEWPSYTWKALIHTFTHSHFLSGRHVLKDPDSLDQCILVEHGSDRSTSKGHETGRLDMLRSGGRKLEILVTSSYRGYTWCIIVCWSMLYIQVLKIIEVLEMKKASCWWLQGHQASPWWTRLYVSHTFCMKHQNHKSRSSSIKINHQNILSSSIYKQVEQIIKMVHTWKYVHPHHPWSIYVHQTTPPCIRQIRSWTSLWIIFNGFWRDCSRKIQRAWPSWWVGL